MVYKSGFITFFFLSITTISATLQNPQLLTSTAPKEESSHTAMTSYSEDDGWVEGIEFPKENWIMRVLVIKQMLLILQKVHLESDTALKELYNWYESEEATPPNELQELFTSHGQPIVDKENKFFMKLYLVIKYGTRTFNVMNNDGSEETIRITDTYENLYDKVAATGP